MAEANRTRHGDRGVPRTFRTGTSRDYYRKKRAEGKVHTQAALCLARRPIDVLWAMLRDQHAYLQGQA
jgi:hypothetical protein